MALQLGIGLLRRCFISLGLLAEMRAVIEILSGIISCMCIVRFSHQHCFKLCRDPLLLGKRSLLMLEINSLGLRNYRVYFVRSRL